MSLCLACVLPCLATPACGEPDLRAHFVAPTPALPLAVIGRSNVGKSSLINMLTGRSSLAMVSKTPGALLAIVGLPPTCCGPPAFRGRHKDARCAAADEPAAATAAVPPVLGQWISRSGSLGQHDLA